MAEEVAAAEAAEEAAAEGPAAGEEPAAEEAAEEPAAEEAAAEEAAAILEAEIDADEYGPPLEPWQAVAPQDDYKRLEMHGFKPPNVEIGSMWQCKWKGGGRPCCWAYAKPPPYGSKSDRRKIEQLEVFGPVLRVLQSWLWDAAGTKRGFITVVIQGEGDHRWEYVNVWSTHYVNGRLGPVHFAEPLRPTHFSTAPPAETLPPHGVEAGQGDPWAEGPEAAGDAPEGAADEGPGAADEGPAAAWAALHPGGCGVLDPPEEHEFAFLDGRDMERPPLDASIQDWEYYERWCCWYFVHKMGLLPQACKYCKRNNVYFGGGNCAGYPCQKARAERAAQRADRPPGTGARTSTKRRSGNQDKRGAWFGKRQEGIRTADHMAVDPEKDAKAKDTAKENRDAAQMWRELQEARVRRRREQAAAREEAAAPEEAEAAEGQGDAAHEEDENQSWGPWTEKGLKRPRGELGQWSEDDLQEARGRVHRPPRPERGRAHPWKPPGLPGPMGPEAWPDQEWPPPGCPRTPKTPPLRKKNLHQAAPKVIPPPARSTGPKPPAQKAAPRGAPKPPAQKAAPRGTPQQPEKPPPKPEKPKPSAKDQPDEVKQALVKMEMVKLLSLNQAKREEAELLEARLQSLQEAMVVQEAARDAGVENDSHESARPFRMCGTLASASAEALQGRASPAISRMSCGFHAQRFQRRCVPKGICPRCPTARGAGPGASP